ncbi:MAG: alpha-(1-_3)-arabinofuranosyltransferase domain-containing protein, partial [Actinomycetota bacterium]
MRHPRLAALRGPANRRTGDVVTGLALAALVVLPGAGRTTFDTKLDLVVDPVGFLARALSVWNPQSGLGELQNQAVGYLFPIGPFFAAGQLAGVPPWLVQRSWQALLLVGAYAGARRLIGRLGVSAGWAGWLGALAYATGPRMLTTLGPLSAEALAVTMLPWILLPLVPGRTARPPWRAAARSALGVLLLGGANATVTLAVLPLPALWLATRRPGPARRRL